MSVVSYPRQSNLVSSIIGLRLSGFGIPTVVICQWQRIASSLSSLTCRWGSAACDLPLMIALRRSGFGGLAAVILCNQLPRIGLWQLLGNLESLIGRRLPPVTCLGQSAFSNRSQGVCCPGERALRSIFSMTRANCLAGPGTGPCIPQKQTFSQHTANFIRQTKFSKGRGRPAQSRVRWLYSSIGHKVLGYTMRLLVWGPETHPVGDAGLLSFQ